MDLEKIIIQTLIEYQFGDNLKNGEYVTGVKKMYFGEVAAMVVKKYNDIHNVSGSLPTSEELQEIVVKIAYSQQGEEQSDDCYAKMGMLHEFISKYVNGNDR